MLQYKIAVAVKKYLVNLAVEDKLPRDITQLNLDELAEVIAPVLEPEKVETEYLGIPEKVLDAASEFLVYNDYNDLAKMVKAIKEETDQDTLIDFVDDVVVWEKIEYGFTCKAFLELINYDK